jgi:hypothetical protein
MTETTTVEFGVYLKGIERFEFAGEKKARGSVAFIAPNNIGGIATLEVEVAVTDGTTLIELEYLLIEEARAKCGFFGGASAESLLKMALRSRMADDFGIYGELDLPSKDD